VDECKPLIAGMMPDSAVEGGWIITFPVLPKTAPWRYVPIYLYWAVFDTQAAADAARAIDIVNLVKNVGASADVPVNADGSAGPPKTSQPAF